MVSLDVGGVAISSVFTGDVVLLLLEVEKIEPAFTTFFIGFVFPWMWEAGMEAVESLDPSLFSLSDCN